jgi:hypothetical protein
VNASAWDTFALIAGGPSLTVEDVEYVRNRARVIAINDAYRLAPWAHVLYAADARWIEWHNGVPGFRSQKYSIESRDTTRRPDWIVLRNTGFHGLELEPNGLRTGFNSGYQALNLAVHMGAKRIVLLGFDMAPNPDGPSHWFGEHPVPSPSPYADMRAAFDTLVEPLSTLGIEVVNCSRRTALTCFPCASLEDAFVGVAA